MNRVDILRHMQTPPALDHLLVKILEGKYLLLGARFRNKQLQAYLYRWPLKVLKPERMIALLQSDPARLILHPVDAIVVNHENAVQKKLRSVIRRQTKSIVTSHRYID